LYARAGLHPRAGATWTFFFPGYLKGRFPAGYSLLERNLNLGLNVFAFHRTERGAAPHPLPRFAEAENGTKKVS
jgi:hypothetical protein